MELTDQEVKVLRDFLWKFNYALAAFFRECPRPSPNEEYAPRMKREDVVRFLSKFNLEWVL